MRDVFLLGCRRIPDAFGPGGIVAQRVGSPLPRLGKRLSITLRLNALQELGNPAGEPQVRVVAAGPVNRSFVTGECFRGVGAHTVVVEPELEQCVIAWQLIRSAPDDSGIAVAHLSLLEARWELWGGGMGPMIKIAGDNKMAYQTIVAIGKSASGDGESAITEIPGEWRPVSAGLFEVCIRVVGVDGTGGSGPKPVVGVRIELAADESGASCVEARPLSGQALGDTIGNHCAVVGVGSGFARPVVWLDAKSSSIAFAHYAVQIKTVGSPGAVG